MGSRRTTTRSVSLNGKSSNGNNVNGTSRPGGCSYISNVRPENRSTLCSVMAQLTEETQPSFETTLKSKAVSENCNVKFSCVVTGHPAPHVTWYKDDMQLDRYCGLPKYEIFRNGKNNSLHIYNCTVEDAAIYQASAINTKGIVSCSGVLEVGEMNEFKIHQRYFAKLKQKAVQQRKETGGKDDQEPLRTISPDRTQRKRRSTVEAFCSTPSSTEGESNEESHQAVARETEVRLQKATEERVEEKPVINGQVVNENGIKGGTYINDTTQQPKTPFVKKKIKISNGNVSKADTLRERLSDVRRAKDETLDVLPCTDSIKSKGTSEEILKVDKKSGSRIVDSRNIREQHRTSATPAAEKPVERLSKNERICVVSPQTEQLTVSPTVFTSDDLCQSGTQGSRVEKLQHGGGRKDTQANSEKQEQFPNLYLNITSSQLQSNVDSTCLSKLKEGINKTDNATAMDIDKRPDSSTAGSLAKDDLKSVDTQYSSRAASSERPCEQAGGQLSKKETSPRPKSVSENKPLLPREVTQAHTKNWHDVPVNLNLLLNKSKMDLSPHQKKGNVDVQTPSLNCGLQAAVDNTTQDKWDHSRPLNESGTVFFTDRQTSPMERLGGGENNLQCNVSPPALQSQVDPTVKVVEGTEAQVDDKVEDNRVGELLMKADNMAPNHTVELEIEAASLRVVEKTRDAADSNTDTVGMEASCKEKKEPLSKLAEESCSELQSMKSDKSDTVMPHVNTQEQTIEFKEITKPDSKVISVAELLRSQLKALELLLENPVPFHGDFVQERTTTAAEACQGLRTEVKKSEPERKTETISDEAPPTNIKATLMEVYRQVDKIDQEPIQTQSKTLVEHVELDHSSQKNVVNETTGLRKENADINQETGASLLVPLTESQNGKDTHIPLTCKDKLANSTTLSNVSQRAGNSLKVNGQESKVAPQKHTQEEPVQGKDMDVEVALEMKLNDETGRVSTEVNFDQNSLQKFPTQSVLSLETPEKNPQPLQPEISVVEEISRTDSLITPTLESSPLLTKRDCISPIPSATPQELASGARRKILVPKAIPDEATEATSPDQNQDQKKEVSTHSNKLSVSPASPSTSPSLSQRSALLQPPGERTSPVEKRSPLLNRRKTTLEAQVPSQQSAEKIHDLQTEQKPTEKLKHDPFKAPQVIRKIRGETFADASGHLKLWCQFFNVLSESTIKWYKNDEEIIHFKRNAGDETQVNLAIVQASCRDTGVYRCSITNEYGTVSTDTLLSAEILAGMSLREDLGVGEEIEMMPLLFSKGVADSGMWGSKLFGRIMMQESHIGEGCSHKVWRAQVIYGLEPVFESGNTCIIKARNPIAYGGKGESCLTERNLDIVKQECRIQNLAREYCKIFAAEVRGIENFGPSLEVLPVYLMYRPANTVPYVTVEADLTGVYQIFCDIDHTGRKETRPGSVVEQKCCSLQHWIFQWTSGNLLLTRLEGVDNKITNVGISVKSTGHQGLPIEGNPKVFEHFVSQHQCNYFCGLLGLRSLKVIDSLLTPTKPKGSKSPLLQRKLAAGSSSPQMGRKAAGSPRLQRKAEPDVRNTPTQEKAADAPKVKIT